MGSVMPVDENVLRILSFMSLFVLPDRQWAKELPSRDSIQIQGLRCVDFLVSPHA
jgi:hypothetical protein